MKFIIYMEGIILFPIWEFFMFLHKKLQYIGQSAEWYAERGIHAWEAKKAIKQYCKEYDEELKKSIKEVKEK